MRRTATRMLGLLCCLVLLLTRGLADTPGPPPGYKLVWSDEFAGVPNSLPDPDNWNYDLGANGWGNNELENYVKDIAHAHIVEDNDATDRRALQILATSDNNGKFESARLLTAHKREFRYGYIEARIRLPYGQGIWPAFWMLGANIFDPGVGWPRCGEIDIMENIGKTEWWGKNESSLHGPGYSGGNSIHEYFNLPQKKYFKDAYHVFAILWQKDRMTFFVDGTPFETRTPADVKGKEWVFNHPFFFLLDLAVGGNFPGSPDASTTFPQKMLVDYIRVYQKKETDTPSAPDGNSDKKDDKPADNGKAP